MELKDHHQLKPKTIEVRNELIFICIEFVSLVHIYNNINWWVILDSNGKIEFCTGLYKLKESNLLYRCRTFCILQKGGKEAGKTQQMSNNKSVLYLGINLVGKSTLTLEVISNSNL